MEGIGRHAARSPTVLGNPQIIQIMTQPSQHPLQGKTCLITGANSGIGRITAEALATMGATVVLVCRNAEKGETARREIIQATGNTATDLLIADMGSLNQVQRLAGQFTEKHESLHILINNAGLILGERTLTEDGFETTFAVNHLGHFMLTRLLLNYLKTSMPSRIINVSSMVHRWAGMDFDNLQGEKRYRSMDAYARSKLANVLFTYQLAEQLKDTDVTVNCLHPGIVATEFGNRGALWYRLVKPIAKRLFYISPEKGAETLTYLASSPEVERVTGKYFVSKKAVRSSAITYDRALQEKFWDVSLQLTGNQ